MTRAELLAHLDTLTAAGHPPVCWSVPVADRAVWTSEDPGRLAPAATLCQTCPALTPCRRYGLEHPREFGTYGGLTDSDRRRTDRPRKDSAA